MRVLPELKSEDIVSSSKYFAESKGEKLFSTQQWFLISIGCIVLLSSIFVLLLTASGLKSAVLMLVLLIAIPIAIAIIGFPKFGIIVLLIAAYFIMWIISMGLADGPLGTVMDGIQALLILGFFLHQKYRPDWSIFKTPIATIILIWVSYTILQIANPTAESREAWFYTVRSMALVCLMYFVFSYHIRTLSFVRLILNIWMFLSFIGALNAFKQQYFGFFAFEEATFDQPLVQLLLFINGEWRKFSIFSDPVAFSYNMTISTIFCMCMVISPHTTVKKKVLYTLLGVFCTTTMLYSATRAAYILLPSAIILYIVLNLNRQVVALGIIGGMLFLALINVPTSNVTLYRFQSAFKPSDDASFNARANNQKRIQPYIQTHPFGGGLGSTGAWGMRFSPHSFLAQLPPDSTYVRVAVETGWVGLLILLSIFFIVLKQGIINYYRIRDPELKAYCLAMTLIIFALNIGSYPQESLVQFPVSIYFYFFIALINITLKLDQEKQAKEGLALQKQ